LLPVKWTELIQSIDQPSEWLTLLASLTPPQQASELNRLRSMYQN
jgi:hypothetical protein